MMNRLYTTNIIKRSLLLGMATVTLFTSIAAPAKAVFADAYDEDEMVECDESINMADWMSYMPNDIQISRLNIPGSHDAGMYNADKVGTKIYYETQSINLYKQLEAGSRVLDIRLGTMYMGERDAFNLIVHHSEGLAKLAEKGEKDDKIHMHLRLWNVLETVDCFLCEHRDETVVLYLQDHGKTSAEAKEILDEFKDVLKSGRYYKFLYYGQGEEVPKLGDVRGRCVVIYDEHNRTKYEDHDYSNHNEKINYFEHMMDYAERNVCKPSTPDRFIQEALGNPPFSSDDKKGGYKEGDPNIKLVYMSANCPPRGCPSVLAHLILGHFASGREWKRGVRYGWVMMDYVGASDDSKKVIKKIVYSNLESANYTAKDNNVNITEETDESKKTDDIYAATDLTVVWNVRDGQMIPKDSVSIEIGYGVVLTATSSNDWKSETEDLILYDEAGDYAYDFIDDSLYELIVELSDDFTVTTDVITEEDENGYKKRHFIVYCNAENTEDPIIDDDVPEYDDPVIFYEDIPEYDDPVILYEDDSADDSSEYDDSIIF